MDCDRILQIGLYKCDSSGRPSCGDASGGSPPARILISACARMHCRWHSACLQRLPARPSSLRWRVCPGGGIPRCIIRSGPIWRPASSSMNGSGYGCSSAITGSPVGSTPGGGRLRGSGLRREGGLVGATLVVAPRSGHLEPPIARTSNGATTRVAPITGTAVSLFSAGCLAVRVALRLLLGLEVFAGLLVDHLHRQPDLAAFVEAQQLDLHLVAFLDDI
jgi:hypothetical protein